MCTYALVHNPVFKHDGCTMLYGSTTQEYSHMKSRTYLGPTVWVVYSAKSACLVSSMHGNVMATVLTFCRRHTTTRCVR